MHQVAIIVAVPLAAAKLAALELLLAVPWEMALVVAVLLEDRLGVVKPVARAMAPLEIQVLKLLIQVVTALVRTAKTPRLNRRQQKAVLVKLLV